MALAPFDIICALLLLIFAARAALRGFVEEASAMASIVLGLLLAGLFFDEGAAYIRGRGFITMKVLPEICAFVLIFLIVFIAVKIIELLLKDIIKQIKLGTVDRLLGFFFGLAEGFLVIIIVLFIIQIQPLFDKTAVLQGSIFAELLSPAPALISEALTNV